MNKHSTPIFNRSSLVLGLRSATIAVAVFAIFHQDLAIIANDALQTEAMSHILAIPLLFAYLIYRKRKVLRAVVPFEAENRPEVRTYLPTIAGTILSTFAILLYWHGSYTFMPLEYHMAALPIFTAGLILVLFNVQTLRQLAFPIAFLILLMPPPSEILYTLGSTLSVMSSEASFIILSCRLGIPSILTSEYGNPVIEITRFGGESIRFALDIACSGIYSVIGFVIFSVFVAHIIRDKLWKKLALFLIGFLLIYIVNIVRVTTIILIGYHYGEETALQVFHMLGGWTLIFLSTLLLLIVSEKVLHTQLFSKPPEKCSDCNLNFESNRSFCLSCGRVLTPTPIRFRKTDIIKVTGIIVSIVLLMSIQAPVFALTEGPAEIIIQTPTGKQGNTELLPQIPDYTVKFVYRDENFEERSGQDASLLYVYMPLDKALQPVWVTFEIGTTTSSIHPWEVCLISVRIRHGWPTLVTSLALEEVQIQENPPIKARFFAFQWLETNKTQAVLYWYETSRFMVNSTSPLQKQVKISLITYPETPQDITGAEGQLLPLAMAISNHWQPIKTWSQIALLLSQNGAHLTAIAGVLLAGTIFLYVLDARKQRKANTEALLKLSKPNKQIIGSILEAEKTKAPTLNDIATIHKNKTGEYITKERLLLKLSEMERMGTIKSEIVSKRDEPIQIWKTQISGNAF